MKHNFLSRRKFIQGSLTVGAGVLVGAYNNCSSRFEMPASPNQKSSFNPPDTTLPPVQLPAESLPPINWLPTRDSKGEVLFSEWQAMRPFQWHIVSSPNNKLADIMEKPYYPSSSPSPDGQSITGAWCGAAWDASAKRLIIQGGGHGDGHMCENGIYSVSLVKLECQRLVNRSSRTVEQQYNISTKKFEPWDPNTYGYPGAAHPLKDGTPGGCHTYNGLVFIPSSTMRVLGYLGNTSGGLLTPWPVSICNLDDGSYSVPYWRAFDDGPGMIWDMGYQLNNLSGTKVVFPHGYYYHGVIDLAQTAQTRWSQECGKASSVAVTLNAGSNPLVEKANKVVVKMPERGEYVVLATEGKSQRVKYEMALAQTDSDWTAFQDTITLTSVDGSHLDFNATNLLDAKATLLNSAGAAYDHSTETIWIQGNTENSKLYRITGVSSKTWTVERLDNVPTSIGEQSGIMQNYNRFAFAEIAGVKVLLRVTGVDHPIQVIRVG